VTLEGCLHMGWRRHKPVLYWVPSSAACPHQTWRECVPGTLQHDHAGGV